MPSYEITSPDGHKFTISPPDQESMTHQAEQPNPVPGALKAGAKAATDFATGGLQRALDLPNSAVGRVLQSDAANTALGATTGAPRLWSPKTIAEVIERRYGGASFKQIANELGPDVTSQAVRNALHRADYGRYSQKPGEVQPLMNDPFEFKDKGELPLQRDVLERGRSGRPTKTKPLPITSDPYEVLERNIIPAYHGSPHDFDKFNLSKIGTGEGAQAYGHGLYFAENEGVAKEYRDQFNRHPGSEADAKMYQVGIKADPEHFLDWDKPLSEQHPKVREALAKVAGKTAEGLSDEMTGELALQWLKGDNWTSFAKRKYGYNAMLNDEQASQSLREAGIPGIKYRDQGSRIDPERWANAVENAQYKLAEARKEGNQRMVDSWEQELARVQKEASKEQTRNYVVFDDKRIDIMKKYGLAGLAAPTAGAALSAGGGNNPLAPPSSPLE